MDVVRNDRRCAGDVCSAADEAGALRPLPLGFVGLADGF